MHPEPRITTTTTKKPQRDVYVIYSQTIRVLVNAVIFAKNLS
jgi:hypothetical protein